MTVVVSALLIFKIKINPESTRKQDRRQQQQSLFNVKQIVVGKQVASKLSPKSAAGKTQ